MKTPLTLVASLLLTVTTFAHTVWLEPLPGGELSMRFGEWGGDVETSPGHLDSLFEVKATQLANGETKDITAEKKADHYLLIGSSAKHETCVTTNFPVMKRGEAPGRFPIFYARWWTGSAAALPPVTTLDLVPTANPLEVQVMFQQKPLGKGIELRLATPADERHDLVTDDRGIITLPKSEKAGLYLLTLAKHSEEKAGEFQGSKYEVTSHNAALIWQVK